MNPFPIDLGNGSQPVIDLAEINLGVIDLGGGTSSWHRGPDFNADFNQDFRAALPEDE